MATKKITELTGLVSGSVISANDVLPIVDLANDITKKITVDNLAGAMTASWALNAISASHEITHEVSSSYAQTASLGALGFTVEANISGGFTSTASFGTYVGDTATFIQGTGLDSVAVGPNSIASTEGAVGIGKCSTRER